MKARIARLRGRLTYANVAASLALFIALGGTSYAAITLPRNSVGSQQLRAGAVRGTDIQNRTIQVKDISRRARASFRNDDAAIIEHAVINSSGGRVSGTAIASAWSGNAPDLHRVEFGRDVSQCTYSATLVAVPGGNVTEPSPGRIIVSSAGGAAVNVRTFDAAGTPAELPFHLTVIC